jgi:uncharacterized protein YecE (DUF72 family)
MKIHVGCCGWATSMKEYFEKFSLIEIQTTFYKLPKIETVEKWRKQAPKNFIFCVKAFQGITHPTTSPTWKKSGFKDAELKELKDKVGFLRPTREVFNFWIENLKICEALNSPVCLIQLPSSFKENKENLENAKKFFSEIDRRKIKIALELRGWSEEGFSSLCKKFDLIEVTDPLVKLPTYLKDFAYFRLHGSYEKGKINYRYKYSKEDLEKLKNVIYKLKVKEVFVLFNNIYMKDSATEFLKLLENVK